MKSDYIDREPQYLVKEAKTVIEKLTKIGFYVKIREDTKLMRPVSHYRYDKIEMYKGAELKIMVRRYYMSYWANRRICMTDGELSPAVKGKLYYERVNVVA